LTPPPGLLSWAGGPGEEVGIVLVEVSVLEQRYDAVKEVLADGLSVTEVAERYGVARQTCTGGSPGTAREGWGRSPTGPTDPTAARIRCRR
jgi:hypothetical protein